MEKDGASEMDRKNKKNAVVLEKVGNGGIILELIKKRKRNWLGHWPQLAERCSRRNGKREEGSQQKKISDDRQHCDKWTV